MTDATIARTGPDHRAAFRAATFGDVLRSEWTKLRSVRSTFWALTVTVVLGVGLGAAISAAAAHGYAKSSVSDKLSWDPLHRVLRGPGPHQRPCPPRGARGSRGSPGGGRSGAGPDRPGGAQRRRGHLAPAPGRRHRLHDRRPVRPPGDRPGAAGLVAEPGHRVLADPGRGQLASVHHSAHTLQPWPGFGVMCLFVAIVYAIAWTLLDRRDA
jgi:hypothetical protein